MTFRDFRAKQVADALKSYGVFDVQIDYICHEYRYVFELDGEELRVCVPFCEFNVCSNADIEEGVAYTIYNLVLSKAFEKCLKWED